MSVLSSEILAFLNIVLGRNPAESQATVDEFIKIVLADLSDLHILKANDVSLTLVSTDTYLEYPTDALDDDMAIISVALTDSSGDRKWPLEAIEGGWREYQRSMENFVRDTPLYYACANRRIYLYPPPGDAMTSDVWYWKRHADSADTIEFPDSFRNCLKFGAGVEFAVGHKLVDPIALGMPRYLEERDRRRRWASTTAVGG